MKSYKSLLCAMLVAVLSSCSVTRSSMYSPASTRLNVELGDMEYLGEAELSVEYRTYIGFISVVDKINGELYDGVETKTVNTLGQDKSFRLCHRLNKASYKLLEDYPDADYFVVVNQTKSATRWFLGGSVTAKARVKAYRFNK